MTQHYNPDAFKFYRISEEELKTWESGKWKGKRYTWTWLLETKIPEIRSRPHTGSTVAPLCPHWGMARTHYPDGDKNEWCCLHESTRCNREAAIRNATLDKCRRIVFDRVVYGKCPYNGDCGQCFLCDNAGGCIVITEESLRSTKEQPK